MPWPQVLQEELIPGRCSKSLSGPGIYAQYVLSGSMRASRQGSQPHSQTGQDHWSPSNPTGGSLDGEHSPL